MRAIPSRRFMAAKVIWSQYHAWMLSVGVHLAMGAMALAADAPRIAPGRFARRDLAGGARRHGIGAEGVFAHGGRAGPDGYGPAGLRRGRHEEQTARSVLVPPKFPRRRPVASRGSPKGPQGHVWDSRDPQRNAVGRPSAARCSTRRSAPRSPGSFSKSENTKKTTTICSPGYAWPSLQKLRESMPHRFNSRKIKGL